MSSMTPESLIKRMLVVDNESKDKLEALRQNFTELREICYELTGFIDQNEKHTTGDTDMKLTPDELANAVNKLIADNGDALKSLTLMTLYGEPSYNTIVEVRMDGKMTAVFTP